MEREIRRPDKSTRLRLVDVRVGAGHGRLHFGGGLAGVLTASPARSSAAHWIAAAVVGPRPADADGSIDIAGRLLSVRNLPSPLLPPSSPAVLDRDVVRAHWQTVCVGRRDDLAAIHASRRLERHRIDAALERARTREIVPPEPAEDELVDAMEAAAAPVDDALQLRAHVQTLVTGIDALLPGPSPEALILADAWDAHALLVRACDEADAEPRIDAAAAEQRVNIARIAVAMSSGGVPDDARDEINRRHRAVVEGEGELFEARRKDRAKAVARYEAAVAAELDALADAGIDSYAAFLVAITGGDTPLDAAGRQAAQEELAAAKAELDTARHAGDTPDRAELDQREAEMRGRAEVLLGRAPGEDPPGELRALRIDAASRAERVRDLERVLRDAGIEITGDVVAAARELLASELPEPAPQPEPEPAPVEPDEQAIEAAAAAAEIEMLEQQLVDQERALDELEAEMARLDEMHDADVARLAPEDFAAALEALLDAYRAGDLLAGRLPVVLDGVLDGLAPEARDAAVAVLAGAADVQSIVVTDDPQVMQTLDRAGATIVRWPEAQTGSVEVGELQTGQPRGA